ncbi:GNAT family protein [Tsukamurella soli]
MTTAAGQVRLRPIRTRDAAVWSRLRLANQRELQPWEPTGDGSWARRHQPTAWPPMSSTMRSQAREGTLLPLVIEVNGRFAGQLTVGNIVRGQLMNAWVGYWVDSAVTGRGVATVSVALALDHCFGPLGLHRVEATVRPENGPSRAVLAHVGFREEGLLRRYLHVDGQWCDHLLMGMTAEEVPDSVVARLVRAGRAAY